VEAFDHFLPEIARAEMRLLEVPEGAGVPAGKYLLREYYCTEPDCDCRRVVVAVTPFDQVEESVAVTVSFGWERQKYYKKWTRVPGMWRGMSGAILEPLAAQGPHAKRFLEIFKHAVQDHLLVAAFRRHYALVKEIVRARELAE
jgi:hypothetical protein